MKALSARCPVDGEPNRRDKCEQSRTLPAQHPTRHARACPGHPRVLRRTKKTWTPGTSPGVTTQGWVTTEGRVTTEEAARRERERLTPRERWRRAGAGRRGGAPPARGGG